MIKPHNKNKANDVNETPSNGGVASGTSCCGQQQTGRHQTTGPGTVGTPMDLPASDSIKNQRDNATGERIITKERDKHLNQNRTKPMTMEDMFISKNFTRFFTLKSAGESNLAQLNMFKVDKAIKNQIGICEKISEDFQNKSWTVEVKTEEQGTRLMKMTTLMSEQIIVTPHEHHNRSQGVITCTLLKGYSDEEITDELAEQGVIHCRRIIKNIKSQNPEPTSTLILTFKIPNPPERITIRTGLKERVRPYIPLPRRCFNCHQYGHSSLKCRRLTPICLRCGGDIDEDHKVETCQLPVKCIHCQEPHIASSKLCPKYLYEKEILAVKTKEHLTFHEARAKVNLYYDRPKTTYATVTKNLKHQTLEHTTNDDNNNNISSNKETNQISRKRSNESTSSTEMPSKATKQPKTGDTEAHLHHQGDSPMKEINEPPNSEVSRNDPPMENSDDHRSRSRSRIRASKENEILNTRRKHQKESKNKNKQS